MSALTTQMMLSSMLGYVALGAAIAAFLPAVITNAINRRSQTGPWFLVVWLLADIANLVGIILLGAAVTQVALAAWYFIIDGVMLVQLLIYGHDDLRRHGRRPRKAIPLTSMHERGNLWQSLTRRAKDLWKYGRPPRKAIALARIHERGNLWQSLTRQFEEFSVWDDVKLLGFCVAGAIAAWGVYMTLGLYASPETFAIKIPEGFHPLSFGLGMAAITIFTLARAPEIRSGFQRSKRGEKPEHTLTDALWWFLIFENFFNLAAILTLSTKPQYLLAELPFILGAVLPILFDGAMLFAIRSWHRSWEKLDTPAARKAKVEEKAAKEELDLLDEERYCVLALTKLQEIKREVETRQERLKHAKEPDKAKKKHNLTVELEHLNRDILTHQTALQELENEIAKHFKAADERRSKPRRVEGIVRAFAGEGREREVPPRSASTGRARSGSGRRSVPSNV